jgi:hypothetical protein
MEPCLKGSNNYKDWAQEAQGHLKHFSLWKYIDPTDPSSIPPPAIDVTNLTAWNAKNKLLITIMMIMIDHPLQHFCVSQATAHSAWTAIQVSLSPCGPMYQLSMLKHALSIHFTDSCDIDSILLSLTETLDKMFSHGPLDPDHIHLIIIMNALTGSTFLPLHDQLEGLLTSTCNGIT